MALYFRIAAGWMAACILCFGSSAQAFCGFYVAKADAKLFNKASQVVLARDGNRTVLTMVNDFQGDPKEFAVVVPVPTVLEREQINVGNMAAVDHLDAYTAPRLVKYHDPNPCEMRVMPMAEMRKRSAMETSNMVGSAPPAPDLGVTIEASYTVGEYDILILSAQQSDGLVTWLKQNRYRIPEGAESVLGSYIKQDMKFFVAKVNLKEQQKLGFNKLRPLQVAYEHARFMLPIRLGTVNAQGMQDLLIYALTRTGRVTPTNYRMVKLPTGMDVPLFVSDAFGEFYKDMFAHQAKKEDFRAVFLEYAWDMAWCDPCAADPLSSDELRNLGAYWVADNVQGRPQRAQNVYVTRMHVRYDAERFPQDLAFQTTTNRQNFQGRYVLRYPAKGDLSCMAGQRYKRDLKDRWERDVVTLASLTGWPEATIRDKMDWSRIAGTASTPEPTPENKPWYRRLWGD